MKNEPNLSFRISRDLGHLHCELHHHGLSSRTNKELTVVKVCCSFFKEEVIAALRQKYGDDLISRQVRIQLPTMGTAAISSGSVIGEE